MNNALFSPDTTIENSSKFQIYQYYPLFSWIYNKSFLSALNDTNMQIKRINISNKLFIFT